MSEAIIFFNAMASYWSLGPGIRSIEGTDLPPPAFPQGSYTTLVFSPSPTILTAVTVKLMLALRVGNTYCSML